MAESHLQEETKTSDVIRLTIENANQVNQLEIEIRLTTWILKKYVNQVQPTGVLEKIQKTNQLQRNEVEIELGTMK